MVVSFPFLVCMHFRNPPGAAGCWQLKEARKPCLTTRQEGCLDVVHFLCLQAFFAKLPHRWGHHWTKVSGARKNPLPLPLLFAGAPPAPAAPSPNPGVGRSRASGHKLQPQTASAPPPRGASCLFPHVPACG